MTTSNADLLSTLNPEQRAAVTAENRGALLVLAGAGCGKTAVLTRRIVYLVRGGIEPSRICALTFSRKAAEEMSHRLVKLEPSCGGRDGALVTTFHAFALRVLQEPFGGVRNFGRIGFGGKALLLDNRQRYEILSQVSTTAQRKALRVSVTELGGSLNLLAAFYEKASKKWDEAELKLLTGIERDFAAVRKERGLWDFSDLIHGCLKLFREHPEIAAEQAGRYDAVLVDEFQDTNPMQIDLLDVLLGNGTTRPRAGTGEGVNTENRADEAVTAPRADADATASAPAGASLYAVGDDDQAIYGFQGADIRTIRNFTSRFSNSRIVKLQINYRSVTPILNCANRLWASKPEEYRKTLVSGLKVEPPGCRKPLTMHFGSQEKMLGWALGRARFIQRRENIPINSMAMLFRLNDTLDSVSGYFSGAGLSEEERPQLLTVHASKGLEYPVVFLCDLEEGVFPHYKLPKNTSIGSWTELLRELVKPRTDPINASCDIDEELRLFYVGITRAQRFLFFVTVSEKPFHGRTMKFRPSRFLKLVR